MEIDERVRPAAPETGGSPSIWPILIKADDLMIGGGLGNWTEFARIVSRNKACADVGFIARPDPRDEDVATFRTWLDGIRRLGCLTFFDHGIHHTREEFTTGSRSHHVATFRAAADLQKRVFGAALTTFGAPFNAIGEDAVAAFLDLNPKGLVYYPDIVDGAPERRTYGYVSHRHHVSFERTDLGFNPSFEYFKRTHARKIRQRSPMVLQIHPARWSAEGMKDFNDVLTHLRRLGATFVSPAAFVRETVGIGRREETTTAVAVVAKSDTARARTTSWYASRFETAELAKTRNCLDRVLTAAGVPRTTPQRVIDIGCGVGDWLLALKDLVDIEAGFAIEPNADALPIIREALHDLDDGRLTVSAEPVDKLASRDFGATLTICNRALNYMNPKHYLDLIGASAVPGSHHYVGYQNLFFYLHGLQDAITAKNTDLATRRARVLLASLQHEVGATPRVAGEVTTDVEELIALFAAFGLTLVAPIDDDGDVQAYPRISGLLFRYEPNAVRTADGPAAIANVGLALDCFGRASESSAERAGLRTAVDLLARRRYDQARAALRERGGETRLDRLALALAEFHLGDFAACLDQIRDLTAAEVRRRPAEAATGIGAAARGAEAMNDDVLLVGNCHALDLASVLERLTGRTIPHRIVEKPSVEVVRDLETIAAAGTRLAVTQAQWHDLRALAPTTTLDPIVIPHIRSRAYHPDIVNIYVDGRRFTGLTGPEQSSLVVYGFLKGFDAEETRRLFDPEIYERLGFFKTVGETDRWFAHQEAETGWPLKDLLTAWRAQGPFVYTPNHPKLFVLRDLAEILAAKLGLEIVDATPKLRDRGAAYTAWPVYPGLAERQGLTGGFDFKLPDHVVRERGLTENVLSLDDYVRLCFEDYARIGADRIDAGRLVETYDERLAAVLARRGAGPTCTPPAAAPRAANPYRDLPTVRFWRRSLVGRPVEEIDPVVAVRFTIAESDRVATAGSCFAQHISKTLSRKGFGYHLVETGGDAADGTVDTARGFGLFSARYGNIYTARQLDQLVDRAYGLFRPSEPAWQTEGGFVDPFRPTVEIFPSIERLEEDRVRHFAAVRRMFETLDVFVFTLGLTEAWRSRHDGSVFPLAPGVAGGTWDPERHEFVNFSVADVSRDCAAFLAKLGRINPRARVILTVSPVPLIATYENRHVLLSTTYSKSVLRVVAEEAMQAHDNVDYFPSYEIIVGNYNRGRYYEEDLREVRPEGVEHVMRIFTEHYLGGPRADVATQFARELAEAAVVCDEVLTENQ